MRTSHIAKARDLYMRGIIEADEFERRVGLALAHDPDDPGEHQPVNLADEPGAVVYYDPSVDDAVIRKWLWQPRVYFPRETSA